MKKYAVISMDVEDWYHTYFPEWDVDRSLSLLDGLDTALQIMEKRKIRGSFFVVGEIADQLAEKIRQMDMRGHDIACHGFAHVRPLSLETDEYQKQITAAKAKLESILGHSILGYRAPSFGIDDECLEIVKSCGFYYDSSKLKPQMSSKYGSLNLKNFSEIQPCIYEQNHFREFEVSTQPVFGMNMLLGGGYIRMLPWFFMKYMTRKYLDTGKPYVMYIHPIDLSARPMPKVANIGISKFLRTHIGRKHMQKRFEKVLELIKKKGYEFVTFKDICEMQQSNA